MSNYEECTNIHFDEDNDRGDDDLDMLLMLEEHLSQVINEETQQKLVEEGEPADDVNIDLPTEPYEGQIFESEDAAYNFYNQHAATHGFSLRKNRTKRDVDGQIICRNFCCSNEGTKQRKNNAPAQPKYSKRERRTNCKASLDVRMNAGGLFFVTKYVGEHNHELLSAESSFTLRSHRNMKNHPMQPFIKLAESVGIQPNQSFDYIMEQSGGLKNVGFLRGDHYNFLSVQRQKLLNKGDAVILMEYLSRKKAYDKAFIYEMQMDCDLVVTNFFWSDGRSILDYSYFGDVVCFDTTYKTNKHGRPIGVFVGINHHRHTCVFGSAMLYDETAESFIWLFSTFLKTMSGKAPITIMTDQDPAMAAAIKVVFPHTKHRICLWHLCQNAQRNMGGAYNMEVNGVLFSQAFKQCVFEGDNEEEFEYRWNKLLINYNLEDSTWMASTFAIKEKWALVYGRKVFTGGMRSTQRSESFNGHLKAQLHTMKDLYKFFKIYDLLLKKQRDKEYIADCNDVCSHFKPVFAHSSILQQINGIYTSESYRYQEEEYKFICDTRILSETKEVGGVKQIVVGSLSSHKTCTVKLKWQKEEVTCSCKTFEFMGIICRHIFQVLQHKGVTKIPEKYILKRWMKIAKDKIGFSYRTSENGLEQEQVRATKVAHMHGIFLRIMDETLADEESYKQCISMMEAVVIDVCKVKEQRQKSQAYKEIPFRSCTLSAFDSAMPNEAVDTATSPLVKGFKKNQTQKGIHRIKGNIEKGRKKITRKKIEPRRKLIPKEQDVVPPFSPLNNEDVIQSQSVLMTSSNFGSYNQPSSNTFTSLLQACTYPFPSTGI